MKENLFNQHKTLNERWKNFVSENDHSKNNNSKNDNSESNLYNTKSASDLSSLSFSLSRSQKEYLLALARQSISYFFEHRSIMKVDEKIVAKNAGERVLEDMGVFVTLTKHGELRGCIGYIDAIKPLYKGIIENAVNAAFYDPRFYPLSREELDQIIIEISVLTKPVSFDYSSTAELLDRLKTKPGVILSMNGYSATFLPQVWEELPDREQFLTHLCMKAGLSGNCWKQHPDIKLYSDYAFSEKEA